jgi:hypothetical protein
MSIKQKGEWLEGVLDWPRKRQIRRRPQITARSGSCNGWIELSFAVLMKQSLDFRFVALPSNQFAHLVQKPAEELAALHSRRYLVDRDGYFCRLTLEDAPLGETVILTNYQHQPAESPFQSAHAVYIRETAQPKFFDVNTVPRVLRAKLLSVRAFNGEHYITDAEVVPGDGLDNLLERFLSNPATEYIHVHSAKMGCYFCKVDRV